MVAVAADAAADAAAAATGGGLASQAETLESAPLRNLIGRAKATVQETRAGVDGSDGLATLGAEGAVRCVVDYGAADSQLLPARRGAALNSVSIVLDI